MGAPGSRSGVGPVAGDTGVMETGIRGQTEARYEGYGYGYGQENSGSYGYSLATNSWEMANSDLDTNPEGLGGADAIMAKMSQRLEMVTPMDTEAVPGGHYGAGGDRFDSYDSYDARGPLSDRDVFRFDCPDADGAFEGPHDGFFGSHREQFQPRSRERGQAWGRDGHNHRPSYPGHLGGHWNEPPQCVGSRGLGPPGSSRLPSLFSHNILPELSMFQGIRGFSGNMRYGGGAMKQRMRRNWKMWDSDFKPQKKRIRKDPMAKKQKRTNSSEDPDGKGTQTDGSDNSDTDNEEGTEGESGEREDKEGSRGEGEDEEGKDLEKGALTIQEEISQIKRKLQAGKKAPERHKKRHRDRMVERIQFVCSLCKYRTFYDDEMTSHLESRFHKEHFKFVGTKLPQQTAEFLQEYVANKTRKTEERRRALEDVNAVIQQIYREQDLTQDIGMEHFIKKVEAAHCAACDLFIPMQVGIIQKHLKSLDHNHNRRAMMEQSKKSSLVVARSILNNKVISKKLERYLKGENPFTDDPEEKEEHEEGEGGTTGNVEEGEAEGADENKDEEENGEEENPEEANPEKENVEEENPGGGNQDEENKDPEGAESEGERGETGTEVEAQAPRETETREEQESLPQGEEQQPVESVEVADEEEAEETVAAQEDEDVE
ncbi:PREDICTED: A-kinase anchor protein 8-like [Chaetura pelagica]|uniref:A-kinase anchor protein 8-like n=1 Tax=Chaetura pelagica TaxID=8897 RepID=UPI00052321F7|nr:PREDICTED: A-kinase anchor protein 8-like [Chaetura pelagica]